MKKAPFTWCLFRIIIKTMKKNIILWTLSVFTIAALIMACGGKRNEKTELPQDSQQNIGQGMQQDTQHNTEQEIQLDTQQDTEQMEKRSAVKVAVIDTGFSQKAIPAENIIEGRNYLYPELSTEDTYGHGTAVASIILQYASDVMLVPLVSSAYEKGKIKQVDNDTLAQMILDAVDVYDCDIINISAGIVLDKDTIRAACAHAEEEGVLIVASAGNDYQLNSDVKYYPAAYDTVLAVGALNKDGTEIADFSQRGEWVDIYAIGEEVTISTLSGNTRTGDGSSYSAAKVTAIAANFIKAAAGFDIQQLREKIKEEVDLKVNN